MTFEFGPPVLGILLSGTLMLLLGLIDDLGVLTPFQKLSGQLIAVIALIKAGLFVKLVFLPAPVALALSVLWLLTITNALNIIDIMDGLASGVAAIAALFLAGIAIHNGEPMVAMMASALSGSLFGFLRYNFQPAHIYLGDSGSLFIGLTLGSLAMNGHYTTHNTSACSCRRWSSACRCSTWRSFFSSRLRKDCLRSAAALITWPSGSTPWLEHRANGRCGLRHRCSPRLGRLRSDGDQQRRDRRASCWSGHPQRCSP